MDTKTTYRWTLGEFVGKGDLSVGSINRAEAVAGIARCAEALGYRVSGRAESRITGPKGTVPSVILMGRGEPIPGSDDYNGIRPYNVDVDVEEATGIPANDESPLHFNNIPEGVVGKAGKKESVTVIEGK